MRKTLLTFMLIFPLLFAAGGRAAEFDLDSGRVVLRQLQYCLDCGSALLVTHVHPGVMVRCPDCGKEQPRLSAEYLLTQMYQMCKVCQGPLNPEGHRPGEVVECDNCHVRQPLNRDVFARGKNADGLGYVPGFPPGTGKKTLLLSPNRSDTRLTMIPLDDDASDVPPPPGFSSGRIPAPPEGVLRRPPESAPRPTERAVAPVEVPGERADLNPSLARRPTGGAVDVPAVTADLFGARRPGPGTAKQGFIPSGNVVARVNGEPIYAREVSRVVDPVLNRLREQAGPTEAEAVAAREKSLRREVLERLIDRELAMREAEAIGYRPDPAAVREREGELAQILAGTGVDVRREAIRDVTMTDMRKRYAEKPGAANPAAVREFYARHKHEMIQPRLVALDQLVIYDDRLGKADGRTSRDIALEVSRLLESGERFDALRERYDEFLPLAELEHAAPAMQPVDAYARQVVAAGGELRKGAVFGPLFLSGMALFCKVTEERQEGPIPFEEVEREIRRRLEADAAEKNLDSWLKRLRGKATIEFME